MNTPPEPRLILSDEALDGTLELMMLAEASLWATCEAALEGEAAGLGRGHYRACFLLKQRPGAGVKELADLTGLSKQSASKILAELERAGLVVRQPGEEDSRRRPAALTPEGQAFEARVGERMRAHIARAYRAGGLDAAPAARRILAAMAGSRTGVGRKRRDEP